MWVLALVAICHVGISASFASNSSAIRNEVQSPEPVVEPADTGNARKPSKHVAAPGNDAFDVADMNEQERGKWDVALHVSDRDWHPARAFQAMEVIKTRTDLVENTEFIAWIGHLMKFLEEGGDFSSGTLVELIEKDRTPEELMPLYIWLRKFSHLAAFADQRLSEFASVPQYNMLVISSLFERHASPEELFRVLKIRDKISLTGFANFDVYFKQWFEYITLYRTVAPYDEEKLFNFLVEEVESLFYRKSSLLRSFRHEMVASPSDSVLENLRREVASTSHHSLMYPSTSKSAIDFSRRVVVKLFDFIHGPENPMSLVTDMHRYLILNPELKHIVFEQWVKYTPHRVFCSLHLEAEIDLDRFNIPLFNAWLEFVKVYSRNLITIFPEVPHIYLEYRHLLITMLSSPAVAEKFQSKKFVQMLDRGKITYVTVDDHDNLVELLRVPNLLKQWLDLEKSPAEILEGIKLDELEFVPLSAVKIDLRRAEKLPRATRDNVMSADVTFMAWLSYTTWYMRSNPSFSVEELHRLWSASHYVEKLVTVFAWIRVFPDMEDLAATLLKRMFFDPRIGEDAIRAANFFNKEDWDFLFRERHPRKRAKLLHDPIFLGQ